MKKNKLVFHVAVLILLQFLIFQKVSSQDYARLKNKADTLNFSVEKLNKWQLLNSYVELNKKKDTVVLELILISDEKNIDWKAEQYVGKIKYQKFFSKTERVAICYLLTNKYKVTIKADGKCFFSLEDGSPPSDFPAVLPLAISYKL